jgi:hypothetical protein
MSGGIAQQQGNSLENLYLNNSAAIIAGVIFGLLFLLFISILQFTFPVFYLDLLDKKSGTNFSSKDVINYLKKNAFKLIKFIIGSIFIIAPVMILIFGLNMLLCLIVIGFPLFLITVPAVMSWIHLSFYHYLIGEKRFFGALSEAFNDLKSQFWQIVLSTLVMYTILQIVLSVFSFIPYIYGMATFITSLEENSTEDKELSFVSILMTSIIVVTYFVNYILNNLILVNQGLVYYSVREENESISSKNSIDLIGTDSE